MVGINNGTLLRGILTDLACRYQVPNLRTICTFDEESGNYLLIDEGWRGYKHIHSVWMHVETRNGKFYIHEDGTEEGVATRLMAAGVPQERIVFALDAPSLRAGTGFGVE